MNKAQATIANQIASNHGLTEYAANQFARRSKSAVAAALNGQRGADFEVLARDAAELTAYIAKRDALCQAARIIGMTVDQIDDCFREGAWFEADEA